MLIHIRLHYVLMWQVTVLMSKLSLNIVIDKLNFHFFWWPNIGFYFTEKAAQFKLESYRKKVSNLSESNFLMIRNSISSTSSKNYLLPKPHFQLQSLKIGIDKLNLLVSFWAECWVFIVHKRLISPS